MLCLSSRCVLLYYLYEELAGLTSDSEISKTSDIQQFLPMADGSTLTSVAAHVYNSSWTRGQLQSTAKNGVVD